MHRRFFTFVWRYSKREQLFILALTVASFPLVYYSLEIPKKIVNKAISGRDFPREVFGYELQQVPYLLLLCSLFLFMVILINGIKWVMNVAIGLTGERMLRRLRFMMFEQVMRFRISRFRTTKPGEVIQSMLGEIEPLGGFFGEVVSTPCFQGGLLCVYVTFIFMQDIWLGLAAVSLYPMQAVLIPRLQAKVIKLNRERATNTRALADAISESVINVPDIHTNDTARWHMAQISGRLHTNTMIRIDLFKRKFTIKFINNFVNQLTPFFFYLAGGYLVIEGDMDFGSLVAVLAAYKDLAAPWKALLNYIQRWTDFNSRYEFVVESFTGDDVMDPERIYAADLPPLKGDLELSGIEGGPGTAGLNVSRLSIRPRQTVAVVGGNNGSSDALLRMMAGLQIPAHGSVMIGGEQLADTTFAQLGASVAFVGTEPGIVNRSIRDNLVYGLMRRAPDLADQKTVEAVSLLREARRTGNITADPEGDWIDYVAADVSGPEELDRRLLELVDRVGLADELVSGALDSRIPAADAARWTEPILVARRRLAASFGPGELEDIAEPWVPGVFNTNGTLMANALFGLPSDPADDSRAYIRLPLVIEALEQTGARAELEAIGHDIAKEFASLVEAVEENSAVLDSFTAYPKQDILAAAELIHAAPGTSVEQLKPDQRETLLVLALGFVQTRDRLDVLDAARIARLMECQGKARKLLAGRDGFVAFDEDRFSAGRSIAENILNAKRRYDRKSAWKQLAQRMEAAIRESGLRDDLIRLGLGASAGASGGNLSSTARRRIAIVRGLLKRPGLMVLDGVAGSESTSDRALRDTIRETLPDVMLVFSSVDGTPADVDLCIQLDDTGTAQVEAVERPRIPESMSAE